MSHEKYKKKTEEENKSSWWLHIRELAEARGLDQEQLARRSGVPLRTVVHLWNDPTANAHLSVLAKFASVLKVKLTELIEDSNRQEEQGL